MEVDSGPVTFQDRAFARASARCGNERGLASDLACLTIACGSFLVASAKLPAEQALECLVRLSSGFEQIEPPLAVGAETSPLAHERRVAEQRLFQRKDVEASHVDGRLATLEHEQLD